MVGCQERCCPTCSAIGSRERALITFAILLAGWLIAAAFVDYPLILQWRGVGTAHPGSDAGSRKRRLHAATDLFAGFLRLLLPLRHVFEVGQGAAFCVCVPAWSTGNEVGNLFSPAGFAKAGVRHALPPRQLLDLGASFRRALRGRRHLYVFALAVAPEEQGKGYGRCALRQALRLADARGVPTILETTTERNRALYERHGFAAVGRVTVAGCKEPWYAMLREARESSTTADATAWPA